MYVKTHTTLHRAPLSCFLFIQTHKTMPRPIINAPPQVVAAVATPAAMDVDPALLCQPADGTVLPPAAPTPQQFANVATENLQESVNLLGNRTDLDEEIQLTEGSSSIQKKKKNKKTKAVLAPSSFKNSRAKVTWFLERQSKENPMPCDDDLRLEIYRELEELAADDVHRNCLSGPKDRMTKCSCLTVFRDHTLRLVSANWLLTSFKRSKEEQDREVITWVRYASRETKKDNVMEYVIPFLNAYPGTNEPLTTLSEEHKAILQKSSLCSNGIALFIQRRADYFRTIKQQAFGVGAPKVHGNVGRKRGFITDDAVYETITDFFADLEKLGEVRATRTVKTMCGLANRDEDDGKTIYLPQEMSIRNCYGRYLDGRGFDIEWFNNGDFNVTWMGEGEQPNYPDLTTFFNIWRRDFGHIKVSRSIEDICELCFKFANRHHYMNANDVTSAVDDELFIEDPEDGGEQDVGFDKSLPESEERYQSDKEEEEGSGYDSCEKKPLSEQSPSKPTPDSEGEDVIEDDSEDGEETPTQKAICLQTESREQMLLRANLHVRMARIQRLTYVNLVHKARRDACNNLPHSGYDQ